MKKWIPARLASDMQPERMADVLRGKPRAEAAFAASLLLWDVFGGWPASSQSLDGLRRIAAGRRGDDRTDDAETARLLEACGANPETARKRVIPCATLVRFMERRRRDANARSTD